MAFGKSSINDYDIRIDKEGVWYFRGAEMFRKDFVHLFCQHVKKDADGRYFIEYNEEKAYLDVEDTAFVVRSICKSCSADDGHEYIELLLSDGSVENLVPDTLYVGKNNVMYCSVRNKEFVARFLRRSYYQLAGYIEQDSNDGQYFISLNNHRYKIRTKDIKD